MYMNFEWSGTTLPHKFPIPFFVNEHFQGEQLWCSSQISWCSITSNPHRFTIVYVTVCDSPLRSVSVKACMFLAVILYSILITMTHSYEWCKFRMHRHLFLLHLTAMFAVFCSQLFWLYIKNKTFLVVLPLDLNLGTLIPKQLLRYFGNFWGYATSWVKSDSSVKGLCRKVIHHKINWSVICDLMLAVNFLGRIMKPKVKIPGISRCHKLISHCSWHPWNVWICFCSPWYERLPWAVI
jgi:hypothetical protein